MMRLLLYCLPLLIGSPGMPAAAPHPAIDQSAALSPRQSPSAAQATGWVYTRSGDPQGKPVAKASITSPDVLKVGFPYTGTASATLTLRRSSTGTTLYIQVSQGQFTGSYQGGKVRMRFDGQPWKTYAYSPAANGTGMTIFFDAVAPLTEQLKAARTAVIEVPFNGQGRQSILFRVAGLRWP